MIQAYLFVGRQIHHGKRNQADHCSEIGKLTDQALCGMSV
jgi:hypothetical protein